MHLRIMESPKKKKNISKFMIILQQVFETMGVLISDIAMTTSRARQHNGIFQRCAQRPRDV